MSKRGRPREQNGQITVRALERGLMVLEVLGQTGEISLSEASRRVELPYSTTHRVLETLRQRGFVVQAEETGLYSIGIKAFEVGAAYLSRGALHEVAQPLMQELVEEVEETINLAVLDDDCAVYIHQVEGSRMMRAFTHIGARVPLYCTGVGKVLLAWKGENAVRRLLANVDFRPFTPNTIGNIEDFLAELAVVRSQGYAVDNEERELGVRCVTSPVGDVTGEVVAALSMSAPAGRLPDDRVVSVSEKVRRAAVEISRRLGGAPVATR